MAGARGEGVISAGGAEHHVLFTNRAIAEAEKAAGRGILALLQGFENGSTGIGDVAHLLTAGLVAARRDERASGPPVTLADAYRIMDEAGFADVTRIVMEAISAVLTYHVEKIGEETQAPNL